MKDMPEIPDEIQGDEPPKKIFDPTLERELKESDERHQQRMAALPAIREAAHKSGKEPFDAVRVRNLSGWDISTQRARDNLELDYYEYDGYRTLRDLANVKMLNL